MTHKERKTKFTKWLKQYSNKNEIKKYGYETLLLDFMCCIGDEEGLKRHFNITL